MVNYLFLGNPGTGKSTLINCIIGEQIFTSGVSYGGGLTKFFNEYEQNENMYMDTPGLSDRKLMKQAGEAISHALRKSGTYKLFFMVRLESGRVVADDITTIETVISSIDQKDVPFTVIVNNVRKRQYEEMMKAGEAYKEVVALINAGKYITPYIVFLPTFPELDEVDNGIVELPNNVVDYFHFDAPSVVIKRQDVRDITVDKFMELVEKLTQELERLKQDKAALEQRIKELEEKPGFFRGIGKSINDFFGGISNLCKGSKLE